MEKPTTQSEIIIKEEDPNYRLLMQFVTTDNASLAHVLPPELYAACGITPPNPALKAPFAQKQIYCSITRPTNKNPAFAIAVLPYTVRNPIVRLLSK